MSAVYLFVHCAYLFELTNFKHFSDAKEMARLMISKYSVLQLKPRYTLALFVLEAGSMALNYYTQLIPAFLLINIWILLVHLPWQNWMDMFIKAHVP